MENKEMIIHMVNGDEYHFNQNENFNKQCHSNIDEMIKNMTSGRFSVVIISNDGHTIKYVSRFAIKEVKQVIIAIKNVSSIDLVEERKND